MAISEALKKGGPHKILFFTSTNAGRVIDQDITTMRLILDAAPEIGHKFGIIVNMVPPNLMEVFKKDSDSENSNFKRFNATLFANMEERHWHGNVLFLQRNEQLEGANNVLCAVNGLCGFPTNLCDFVERVPIVNLTPNNASDVKTENWNKMEKVIEDMLRRMEQNEEAFIEMQRKYNDIRIIRSNKKII